MLVVEDQGEILRSPAIQGCRLYNVEMCLNFTAECINAFALHTKSLHETKWLKCYLFQIYFVVEMFISNESISAMIELNHI